MNTIVILTPGELHAMEANGGVHWDNIRARLIEKGVAEDVINRCVQAEPTPAGLQLEFEGTENG